ncbi:MAG: hypothetical protein H5T71_02115, partial [Chloroflexi bacterium]|nr:hypothetical protein [Chloroflexota bacterium]
MTNCSPEGETPFTPPQKRTDAALVWAVLLIAVGVVLLVTQFLGIPWGALLWPLWILVPGVCLLILGFTVSRAGAEPLVVVGSIVSTVGAILFYANATGHWTVWTYAWALIAPTSIGAGLWLLGALRQRRDLTAPGATMVKVGLILFAAFGVFFELIIGVSGWGL